MEKSISVSAMPMTMGSIAYDLATKKITGFALRVQGFPIQMEVLP